MRSVLLEPAAPCKLRGAITVKSREKARSRKTKPGEGTVGQAEVSAARDDGLPSGDCRAPARSHLEQRRLRGDRTRAAFPRPCRRRSAGRPRRPYQGLFHRRRGVREGCLIRPADRPDRAHRSRPSAPLARTLLPDLRTIRPDPDHHPERRLRPDVCAPLLARRRGRGASGSGSAARGRRDRLAKGVVGDGRSRGSARCAGGTGVQAADR